MTARTASDAVTAALDALAACDDPAVVINPVPAELLQEWAAGIDARPVDTVPLRGLTVAVKDNIDVAGVPTTAACPAFAFMPERHAAAVERLLAAGAVPVAKVNLDQFATGLVGTRSPYGTPRNPFDPALVPGGSSSGSAVAVATGLADVALGTDTAGSGRVPAAMCGLVGLKPTRGRLSTRGVLPAVRSIDCVSVFAGTLTEAAAVADALAGFDLDDPYSRRDPAGGLPPVRRLGVLTPEALADAATSDVVAEGYASQLKLLEQLGFDLVEIDPGDLFALGDQLYGGPWVSERLVAIGEFAERLDRCDPTVAGILAAARAHTAADVHRARYLLARARNVAARLFDAIDALAFPTVPRLPTVAEVAAAPVLANLAQGRFTTFTNLADLAAVTFPLGAAVRPHLPPPSLTLQGPAWSDAALLAAAARATGEELPPPAVPAGWTEVVVAGAHLRGGALESQLTDRGAIFRSTTVTAPVYRLWALADSTPPKPAVVHSGADGIALEVDVWALSPAAFGEFVTLVAAPLAIGKVELGDGRVLPGFVSEPRALVGATDVSTYGGWRAYLAHLAYPAGRG